VYTGTHDNATSREWLEGAAPEVRRNFWTYLKRTRGESRDAAPELIRLAWSSPAAVAIAPLQDLLNLGHAARMNVPGVAEGNWRWRAPQQMSSDWNLRRVRELTEVSGRRGCARAAGMEQPRWASKEVRR
jgi:4-alpha-glucanotransferase